MIASYLARWLAIATFERNGPRSRRNEAKQGSNSVSVTHSLPPMRR